MIHFQPCQAIAENVLAPSPQESASPNAPPSPAAAPSPSNYNPTAHDWRMATREIFSHYLGRGYRVVDFAFGLGAREGRYLLLREPAEPVETG